MIITLTARLISGRYVAYDWEVDIEIEESASLDDLHQAIFKAVRFWDDAHLYTFFLAKDVFSRDRRFLVDIEEPVVNIPIKEVFPLPEKQSLFYLFDWGDEWVFKILKSRKPLKEPSKRCKYPRVVRTKGKRPKQYVCDDIY